MVDQGKKMAELQRKEILQFLDEGAEIVYVKTQKQLNALGSLDDAMVVFEQHPPPLLKEVRFEKAGKTVSVFVEFPKAVPPQQVRYQHRGLECTTHGLAAHRRIDKSSDPWECVECLKEASGAGLAAPEGAASDGKAGQEAT